jgi:hypothetical protein
MFADCADLDLGALADDGNSIDFWIPSILALLVFSLVISSMSQNEAVKSYVASNERLSESVQAM